MVSPLTAVIRQNTTAPLDASSNFQCLSPDLMSIILSHLHPIDIQKMARVSRWCHKAVLQSAPICERNSILKFIESLIQNLNTKENLKCREKLKAISNDIQSPNRTVFNRTFGALKEIRGDVLIVKEQILNLICDLGEGTLNRLRHRVKPPNFMVDIYKLSMFERSINWSKNIPDPNCRNSNFIDIIKGLLISRYPIKAIKVFNLIEGPRHLHSYSAFRLLDKEFKYLSLSINTVNDLKRTILMAGLIKDPFYQKEALIVVFRALLERGELGKAQKVLNVLNDVNTFSIFPRTIEDVGNLKKAVEDFNLMQEDWYRTDFHKIVCEGLAKANDLDKVLGIANLIKDLYYKNEALRVIYSELIFRRNFDKAKEVANMIKDSRL